MYTVHRVTASQFIIHVINSVHRVHTLHRDSQNERTVHRVTSSCGYCVHNLQD